MSRTLATLARLRRLEADQARRVLGLAVAQEVAAENAAAQLRAQHAQEIAAAHARLADEPAGLLAVSVAKWLPEANRHVAAREGDVAKGRAAREDAASGLVERRAALDMVDALIEANEQVRRRQAARRLQHRLDELARRPGVPAPAGRPSGAAGPRQPC